MTSMTPYRVAIFALLLAMSMTLAACGGGDDGPPPADLPNETPSAPRTIEMIMFQYKFNPNSLSITSGTTVVFRNKDNEKHNVNIPALNIDKTVEPSGQFSHTFNTTGEFAVSNRFASSPMKATIRVR